MEKIAKVGPVTLLLALVGCGGGGGATNDGGQDRMDARLDMRTDTGTQVDRPPEVGGPSCTDRILNGNETGIDCGGSCPACPVGSSCAIPADCESQMCVGARCVGLSCMNAIKDGNETDTDCGGGCQPCYQGKVCLQYTDCVSYVCSAGICSTPTCTDRVKNQGETDVDCGGSACSKCADKKMCASGSDCVGGRCELGVCSSCTDLTKNGDESDVDCGGTTCTGCADMKVCRVDMDCASRRCLNGVCVSCSDRVQNAGETDVDCGGAMCGKCGDGKRCSAGTDCVSTRCVSGTCISCSDTKLNGDESDIDCGGTACAACANGRRCTATTDCMSRICASNACVAANCTDTVINGSESDVDCGGTDCARCPVGGICRTGSDCATGVCGPGNLCAAATCSDGVRNQGETDVDCGGATTCARCPDFKVCTAPSDCATGMCTMGFCGTVGCRSFGTAGGYLGCERTVPVTALPCEDIRTTGTRTGVGDDSSLTTTLPFPFMFFGTARTSMLISASGALSFNTSNPGTTNACMPTGANPMIAVFWEHLHPGGNVYTQTIGTAPNRRHVIQWDSTVYTSGSTRIDVRAVLKEGRGDIDVCYVATTSGSATYNQGLSATAGIQSGTGTAVQYSCNMAKLVDGLVLTYIAP